MVQDGTANAAVGTPIFSYTDKKNPYGYDDLLSRYQLQVGVRYSF
jgi:hypothetical protein